VHPSSCSEQYPLAEARLADLLARIGATNMLASTLRNLIKRIETEKVRLHHAPQRRVCMPGGWGVGVGVFLYVASTFAGPSDRSGRAPP
jgi:hypothetical protein